MGNDIKRACRKSNIWSGMDSEIVKIEQISMLYIAWVKRNIINAIWMATKKNATHSVAYLLIFDSHPKIQSSGILSAFYINNSINATSKETDSALMLICWAVSVMLFVSFFLNRLITTHRHGGCTKKYQAKAHNISTYLYFVSAYKETRHFLIAYASIVTK